MLLNTVSQLKQLQLVCTAVLQLKKRGITGWYCCTTAEIKQVQLVGTAVLQLKQSGTIGYWYCYFTFLRINLADTFSCYGTDVMYMQLKQIRYC